MAWRFLADESCDFAIVRAMRIAGYDVTAIAETTPGASDQVVIALAGAAQRVLLTEDTDFGELVYAHAHAFSGVILLRFPARARAQLAAQVLQFLERAQDDLRTAFVVLQPGRARIGRSPST